MSASNTARAWAVAMSKSSQVVKAVPPWLWSPVGPWVWVTVLSMGISRSETAAVVSTSRELGNVALATQPA
jgi:hypothetical protein